MSKKWFKCESKREMIGNNENNNKSFDSNNQIKPNGKSFDGRTQASAPHSEDPSRSPSNDTNGCKVCHNDDPSAQFFASGPFYAIEAMAHNINSSGDSSAGRHRSDGCNVLYAEMPHIFNEQMSLRHNKTIDDQTESSDTNGTTDDREWSQSSALDPHFGDNYQLFCYNCCSPLGVDEESHPNHKLYYISTNDSNPEQEVDNRSSLSSPIMLKFCREESVQTLGDPTIDATDSQSDESQTPYTTVIKPKAVRPPIGVNLDEMSDQSNQALPTISFHGSATVLTDSDESAFTQIPRRRSNSEATHHYQSIDRNGNHMPSNSHSHSRPHQRQHQRSKSVNKNFVDSKASFVKFGSMSDKHSTKTDTNVKGIYFARKDSRCDDLAQSNSSSEPIHMTLEEVKNIFAKSQNKSLRSVLKSRISNESEEKNPLNKCKSKSKLKVALENIFRHKRRSDLNRHSYEIDSKKCQNVVDNATNNQGIDSSSPFAHRALPPLPNKPATDESIESIDTNKTDICEELSLSKEEEEKRQKFLDYAASIERVKDCGWYWGPISGEMAEKLLASEPCGSFIVRDSSDEHYIFSLTFKLNGMVRHVRIEHDQGNFSFGSLQKFRSNTIVDFIENAVEHSRSGRFLFFLHRRPVMGPMRVQLLHPVSRFKQIQSLQHMCRFVILKHVRRDLIEELPLPQMLKQYLNTPYYYSEELAQANKPTDESEQSLPPNASH